MIAFSEEWFDSPQQGLVSQSKKVFVATVSYTLLHTMWPSYTCAILSEKLHFNTMIASDHESYREHCVKLDIYEVKMILTSSNKK